MEQLLGHHAILMVRLMRGPVDGENEFVEAAQSALQRNTDELVQAVSSVYGATAASSFETMWTEHVDDLTAYSRAVADDDDEAAADAMGRLDSYSARYGELISDLTGGRLSADRVAEDVAMHVHHLLDAVDAYARQDYPAAFAAERTAYAAMFATGKALSGAAMSRTGELPAGFDSPPAQLRSALGRLLGEHVELAFDATRAVVAGSAAATAAAAALDQNTQEVVAAMSAALAPADAATFSAVWGDHIDGLVRFAVAVADRDDTGQAEARAALDTFPSRLTAVFASVSRGGVAGQAVVAALHEHDQQLLQQVTAFAARDYATSHDLAYAGYDHMFAIAETLAEVLEGGTAATAPRGGAATGGGGLALR